MPTEKPEKTKTTPVAATASAPTQNDLFAQREAELTATVRELRQQLEAVRADAGALRTKLDAAKSAPVGDVVTLHGQSYAVLSTHVADNTFADVKRGFLLEGLTLVAINKVY